MNHEEYMRKAVKAAHTGMEKGDGGPFGAVLVDNTRPERVYSAWNRVLKDHDPTAHAEIVCIRQASAYDLSNHTLYASGYPCPMCMGAILWARIPVVYYCNTYDAAKKIGFDDDRFMNELGAVYNCAPEFQEETRSALLRIIHLPLDAGAELYDAWSSLCGKRMY
jgi:guanine deaminase